MQPGIDPLVGATVGHYRITERLGAGGMGQVCLAEDLKLKRRAAIKFIAADTFRDQARRERFLQEATLAASIEPPSHRGDLRYRRVQLSHLHRDGIRCRHNASW